MLSRQHSSNRVKPAPQSRYAGTPTQTYAPGHDQANDGAAALVGHMRAAADAAAPVSYKAGGHNNETSYHSDGAAALVSQMRAAAGSDVSPSAQGFYTSPAYYAGGTHVATSPLPTVSAEQPSYGKPVAPAHPAPPAGMLELMGNAGFFNPSNLGHPNLSAYQVTRLPAGGSTLALYSRDTARATAHITPPRRPHSAVSRRRRAHLRDARPSR